MGTSPPFLYDHPSTYTFYGPADRAFNPKAVTQASRTRDEPKPTPKGPLLNVDRSYLPNTKSKWTPMSPKTKGRVKYARLIQFVLRVLALLGALASLFCSIVIKNASTAVLWIIRVGPAVAILHTIYGIYHLSRSPVTRPPASQASYMLFASTFDAGLIPFYVFTAFVAYEQYTADMYHWGTLFESDEITHQVAQAAFLLGAINAGFHGISASISIFLAIIFRQISRLPPDMNPLEGNLTARPHKRNKSEITEKHLSQTTADSTDPLIGSPRNNIPFIHTRGKSFGADPNVFDERRQSEVTFHSHRLSHAEPASPTMSPVEQFNQSNSPMPEAVAQDGSYVPTRPIQAMFPNLQSQEVPVDVPDRSDCLSPGSENWVTYPSRSASPVDDTPNENAARRDASSAYSRRSNTTASTATSGLKDWISSAQKYGRDAKNNLTANTRGEYASLTTQEYYGNDEDNNYEILRQNRLYDHIEQDLGDHRIDIFPDDDDEDTLRSPSPPIHPLAMNPPTPQPPTNDPRSDTSSTRRIALSDIPNFSNNQASLMPPVQNLQKKGRFYGELENNTGFSIPRAVSIETETSTDEIKRKRSKKLVKRRSARLSAYDSVHQDDDEDIENQPVDPVTTEGDRRGRVVSNSGADIVGTGSSGTGSSSLPYIGGLGMGRRRDVSGKIAEEGRGGTRLSLNSNGELEKNSGKTSRNGSSTPIRAAGWARFAGL